MSVEALDYLKDEYSQSGLYTHNGSTVRVSVKHIILDITKIFIYKRSASRRNKICTIENNEATVSFSGSMLCFKNFDLVKNMEAPKNNNTDIFFLKPSLQKRILKLWC